GAAQPAINAVGHVHGSRGFTDDVLSLLLRADEKHVAAIGDGFGQKCGGLLKSRVGLAEVDDADALTVIEDEGLRARVPALGLVAKMHAGIQQVFRSDIHVIYVISSKTQVGRWAALRS